MQKNRKLILADYPFKPNFIEIDGVQMHYIDEGNFNAPVILFLHGVPTWSYTFRKIIPICLEAGNRVIAPDLPGFGKSEKCFDSKKFTLYRLSEWVTEFIWKLELKNIFLFAHDWGAILGLISAAKNPEHFSGIIACNGLMPVLNQKVPFLFHIWKYFARYSPIIPVGRIIDFASHKKLNRTERFAYNFPFSSRKEKVAIRILPQLIPLKSNEKGAELIEESWGKLEKWEKPFLTVFGNCDSITRGGEKILHKQIPGTKNQPHQILDGKHFLQEDTPLQLGLIINEFVKNNL